MAQNYSGRWSKVTEFNIGIEDKTYAVLSFVGILEYESGRFNIKR